MTERTHNSKDMATHAGAPRIAYLDVAWATQLLGYYEGRLKAELGGAADAAPTQTSLTFLAETQWTLGLLRYALTFPLDDVRFMLREAAATYVEIFRLRGTSTRLGISAMVATPGWKAQFEDNSATPEGTDESLTNSRTGLFALHLCMATGDVALTQELAPRVYDPEGATYLGEDSEVCTFADQSVAYALRDLVLNRDAAGNARTPERIGEEQRLELLTIASCRSQSGQLISGALLRLLESHERSAPRPGNERNLESFLCLPALALASLALHRGWLTASELPPDSASFPRELCTMAPTQRKEEVQ